jgi:hypothetical protein
MARMCWRTSGTAQWGTLAAFGSLSALAVVDELQSGRSGAGGVQVAVVLLFLWFLFAWRPSLCVLADEVIVRNPLWTHRIPLSDVQGAAPGYFGIVIRRRHRRLPVIAWAVQQGNITGAAGAGARAREAAERILDAADRPSATAG